MTTAAVFAGVDALAGLYLIGYGISRERRDTAGVIVVGGTLMASALILAVITPG